MAYDIGPRIGVEGEKEYKQALSGLTKDMSVLSSEMKKMSAEFDGNANSINALSGKSDLLNRQYDKQKDKVDMLKKALENAKSTYGENSNEVKNWQVKLNNAEADLSKLDKGIKTNSKYLDEAKTSANGTAKSIDEFGKEVKDAGDNTLKTGDIIKANLTSAAIIGGVKALGSAMKSVGETTVGLVTDTAAYADDMLTMSVQTGVSTDKLQAYNYMAELTDTSIDTISKSMAKNIKSMANAQSGSEKYEEAYKRLNVAVVDGNGKLRDGETVYWDVIDALGEMTDETERDAISMQLFGKSAQELNPLIAQGSKGVKALTDEAVSMGAVLSTDTLNALGGTDDAFQRMNQTVEIAKRKFGAEMAPAVTTSVEKITAKISSMDDKLANLAGGALTAVTNGFIWIIDNSDLIVSGLVGISTAMITQASVAAISAVVQGYTDFKKSLDAAAASHALFNAVASANPIGLIATAIVGLGAAMVAYTVIHKSTTSEFEKMEEKIKDVRKESSKLAKEIKTSAVNFSSNAAEAEKNSGAVQVLSDKLYALAGKENKSNAEKKQMQALVNQLNESIPNLNLVMDQQTGQLNKQKVEVNGLVQSMKERAVSQVYEQRYLELAKQQTAAQEKLAEVEKLKKELTEEYNKAKEKQREILAQPQEDEFVIMKANDNIYKFKAALEEAEKGVESAKDNVSKCKSEFNKLDKQFKDTADEAQDYANKGEKASGQVNQALSETEKAYKDAKKAALDSIKSQIDIFDKFSKASDVTKETLLKNLKSQVKGVSDWANNLQSLSKRGIDDGLLKHLKEMGPNAAAQIAALNSMSKKELKNYSDMWVKLGKETAKGAEITVSDTKAKFDKAFNEQTKAAKKAGMASMDAYNAGIKSKQDAVVDNLKRTLNYSADQVKRDAYTSFYNIGIHSIDGMNAGVKVKKSELYKSMSSTANGSLESMKNALEIKSPSKRAKREVGENIALGVIEGIKEKTKEAKKSAQELGEEILSSAKTKLDNYKVYKEMTIQEETDFWNRIRKECKRGTQARIDADKEYYDAKAKQIEEQKQLLESQRTAEETYKENCKKINSELIENVEATTKSYNDAVSARAKTIVNSLGLFDSFSVEQDVSGQELINNLQSQVTGISQWSENLSKLKDRGISRGLLEELQDMGVKSSGEIAALVSLTDEQLNDYVTLWETKSSLAREQAVGELAGLKDETTKKIDELNKQADKDLKNYYTTYKKAMKELGIAIKEPIKQVKGTIGKDGETVVKTATKSIEKEAKSKDTTNKLNAVKKTITAPFKSLHEDGKKIGVNLASGIVAGLISQKNALKRASDEVVETTLERMKMTGDIHSPSRKTAALIGKPLAQGVAVGFVDTMAWASKEMADAIPMNFNKDIKINGIGYGTGISNNSEVLLNAITGIITNAFSNLKLTAISETPVLIDGDHLATILTKAQLAQKRRFEPGGC